MKHLVQPYVDFHRTAWSPTTLRSEASRLSKIAELLSESPENLYKHLQSQANYTIKTTFIRVVRLEAWAFDQGKIKSKPYAEFYKRHKNKFKHAYKRSSLEVTLEEARNKIDQMPSPFKEAAMTLLENGLRISELKTVSNGEIRGKGGKIRKIYGKIYGGLDVSVSTLSAQLKAVGLRAHTLRKLRATQIAERGAGAQDLCHIFGWSSITTAYHYLSPKQDEFIKNKFFGG